MSGALSIGFGGESAVESASFEVITLPPVDPGPVDPGPVDPGPVDPEPVDPENVNDETKITEMNN